MQKGKAKTKKRKGKAKARNEDKGLKTKKMRTIKKI